MSTERLYLRDTSSLAFHGRLLRRASLGGKPSLILDRSGFFPEGGGQPGDRGELRLGGARVPVVDTQIDDDGWVHHLLGEVSEVDLINAINAINEGDEVAGSVDAARRRDFMSQHTGQHMLSSALLQAAGAETVSARLGEGVSTIDVAVDALDDRALHRAEDLTNDVVMSDAVIRVLFPDADELRALPLRRAPKVAEGIRVIDIEGFDCSPCGGTHCARTGQVGPVRVSSIERYKGLWRVSFLAGRRALGDHRDKDAALRELARSLSCGPFDVAASLERLRAELRERSDLLGSARGELTRLLAEATLAAHPPADAGPTRIALAREGDDLAAARALAAALVQRPDVVALVASRPRDGGDWQVVVERGKSAAFDCGAWVKAAAQRHGGRGGGRLERAEGRLPGAADWLAVAAE